MKRIKSFTIILALLSVFLLFGASMAMAAPPPSQQFDFSTTVDPYIAVNPNAILTVAIPAITPPQDGSMPGVTKEVSQNEVAYANCPFRVDYDGNNAAGDNLPILARAEVGSHAGGHYDRLLTRLEFHSVVNGAWNSACFGIGNSGHPDIPNGWFDGRDYAVMNEAPHDGEIGLVLKCGASLPHASPEFGVDNTWDQSADAGPYTCNVVATYSVLP